MNNDFAPFSIARLPRIEFGSGALGQLPHIAARYGPPLLFGTGARTRHIHSREFAFCYTSPKHWSEVFRTYYGPTNKAFAALDAYLNGGTAPEKFIITESKLYTQADDPQGEYDRRKGLGY